MGEDVAHFFLFGFEVEFVVGLGGHFYGEAFYDFYAEAFEAVDFIRVVGEEMEFSGSQVLKDLGTDPIFAEVWGKAEFFVGFYCVIALFLQGIGFDFISQTDTPALVIEHIENQPPAFLFDHFHREVKLAATIAAQRTKSITGQTLRMGSDQYRLVASDLALDQGHMMIAMDDILKNG